MQPAVPEQHLLLSASAAAAFDIQAVTLNPEVVPPGGTLSLVVDVINKQPSITAGGHCAADKQQLTLKVGNP